jgi:hypothetical protein
VNPRCFAVIGARHLPTYLSAGCGGIRREMMKKLVLLVALVIAPGIGADAEAPHADGNVQLAAYHRHHHWHGGYGRMDDPSAEGRTSG